MKLCAVRVSELPKKSLTTGRASASFLPLERRLAPDVAGYSKLLIPVCVLIVGGLTLMRGIFAAVNPLRVDEAYYWTWSRTSVISYLDHPPMISWCIYLGTLIFGDTNFGVRFGGLLTMLVMEALLTDIVWRITRDWRYAILAVLLPEAALNYGLLATKVDPDTALIAFVLAMVWALVRLALSGNQRWSPDLAQMRSPEQVRNYGDRNCGDSPLN